MTSLALGDLAALVGGQLFGDAQIVITGAAIIRDAHAGDITLADRPKLLSQVAQSQASAVLVPPDATPIDRPYVTVSDVHKSFAKIVEHFHPRTATSLLGVSAAAHVSKSAKLGRETVVYPTATVGDDVVIGDRVTIHSGVHILPGCRIGDDVTIFPNAVLYENTVVGQRVVIHAGAVLGAYGFGYNTVNGKHQRCAQLGYVVIEDDVEIGAGATVDRGTYGATTVGTGTKIDNLVQIAHNCRIGRHNLICSQVGIAGSTTTGDYVVLAGQVGVRDHIHIGDRVVVGATSAVSSDLAAGGTYLGTPAVAERANMQQLMAVAKLPEMRKEFRALQKEVSALQKQIADAA